MDRTRVARSASVRPRAGYASSCRGRRTRPRTPSPRRRGHAVEHGVDGDVERVPERHPRRRGVPVRDPRDQPDHLLPHPRHRRRRDAPEPLVDARVPAGDVGVRDEHRVGPVVSGEVPGVLGVRRRRVEEHRDAAGEHGVECRLAGVGVAARLDAEGGGLEELHDPPRRVVVPRRAAEVGAGGRRGALLDDLGAHGHGAARARRAGERPEPPAVAPAHAVLPLEHVGVGGGVEVGRERHAEVDALPRVGLDGEHRRVADR
uniref:Uncharacterized protein n=1 Tax=Oryza brachyantha TaxID=4533 RepID=J3N363_ORYBR